MPRHVGQAIHLGQKWGCGYPRTMKDIHKGYLDMPSTPLFAFGHVRSDTTFEYSPLTLASDTVDVGGEARISLTITKYRSYCRSTSPLPGCPSAVPVQRPRSRANRTRARRLRL